MRKGYSLLKVLSFIFIVLWGFSCRPSDEDTVVAIIKEATVDFPSKATERRINVETNIDDWQAQAMADWCQVSGSGKTVIIRVAENKDSEIRETTINVRFRNITRSVQIRQLGKGLQILVNKQRIPVGAKGGKIDFTVTSNTEVSFQLPNWIQRDEARALMTEQKYAFQVAENKQGGPRRGEIVVVQKNAEQGKAIRKSVIVEQKFDGKYDSTTDGVTQDVQLTIASATSSQAQSGAGIEKSYDGKMETLYHSPWHDQTKMPVTLTYNFHHTEGLDYLVYHPRKNGYNGNFKEVDIYTSTDGRVFHKILSKDFGGSSEKTKIVFKKRLNVKSVRFVIKSGVGSGGNQYASCAEMQFFRNHPNKFDYTTLFADELCSELKSGVTLKDIEGCKQVFYKNIALHLFNGTYQKDFRVAEFKPYLNPDVQAGSNKTNPYSLRDNPTGIEVKQNEELIVFVGAMRGITHVKICVQNLDKPNGDGFGGQTYTLVEGLNRIKVREKGLVYLYYMTKDKNLLKRTGKLKLHFATGTVNGYYDSQNPKHKGRAKELLAAATGKYFDLVGKYAHLTFPTDKFRSVTKDLNTLINAYDKLVKSEMELLGLYKYNKVFQNRMYLNVMYHSYMYATSYHTGYNNNTSNSVLNEDKLLTGDCWGPAHEIGHMNQTVGLKWKGLTEVTNNIMSEYITTTAFPGKSRIQVENIKWGNNRYTKAFNTMLVPKTKYPKAGDPFCRLVPFWQLQLYFGNVLGRTPDKQQDKGGFYPDVYEYYRKHNSVNDMGIQQTEFAYVASKLSGCNLIPFFEKWGFLSPINMVVDDYGKATVKVTQGRINEVKQRVEGLGLPKLNLPLEYITDNNAVYFKNNLHVVKGANARWSGLDIFVENWKNVVVYEVWNKPYGSAGARLVYAGDGYDAKGSPSVAKLAVVREYIGENTPAYLYAVDINNQRIAIPFQ